MQYSYISPAVKKQRWT